MRWGSAGAVVGALWPSFGQLGKGMCGIRVFGPRISNPWNERHRVGWVGRICKRTSERYTNAVLYRNGARARETERLSRRRDRPALSPYRQCRKFHITPAIECPIFSLRGGAWCRSCQDRFKQILKLERKHLCRRRTAELIGWKHINLQARLVLVAADVRRLSICCRNHS